MKRKVYLTKEFMFDAAHHLPNYEGKCKNVHGHTYKLQVTVSGGVECDALKENSLATDYMVMDFSKLKKIVNDSILCDHDHADLNDIYVNPTAEVMAFTIFEILKQELSLLPVTLESVKLWETPTCFAEVKREESTCTCGNSALREGA